MENARNTEIVARKIPATEPREGASANIAATDAASKCRPPPSPTAASSSSRTRFGFGGAGGVGGVWAEAEGAAAAAAAWVSNVWSFVVSTLEKVLSSVIGFTDAWDVTPSTPLALSSFTAAARSASLTSDDLNISSTLYAACDRRRLPAASGAATHTPLPGLTDAFEYADEHAASGSAAVSLADSL